MQQCRCRDYIHTNMCKYTKHYIVYIVKHMCSLIDMCNCIAFIVTITNLFHCHLMVSRLIRTAIKINELFTTPWSVKRWRAELPSVFVI